MAFKDILLTLASYPEPTPPAMVETAVSFAASLNSHIAAIACETHAQIPGHVHFISSSLINIPGMIAEQANQSRKNAQDLLTIFQSAAESQGVNHEKILERCLISEVPELFVEYARLRDLCIVPLKASSDPWYAETVIFGSGKPTLIIPENPQPRPLQFKTILIAWDFSRTAARAIADALPLLESAATVRIVTITNDKVIDTKRSGQELAKNLSRHCIDVTLDEVDSGGMQTGDVLGSHALSCGADLLVMGAYGHSRFREFVLGGATKSMMSKPPLPILFSH